MRQDWSGRKIILFSAPDMDTTTPYTKPPYQKPCKRTNIENPQCSACRVTLNKNKICYNRMCERFAKEPEWRAAFKWATR